MRLEGKVCIVTGGARGIGRTCVEMLAAQGAEMVISCDMGEATYEQSNIRHEILNVTDRAEVEAFMKRIGKEFGRIDVLVNNAGVTRDALLRRMTEDQWDMVIDVNLKGVFNVTQYAVPYLNKSKFGASIITMSSVVGVYGNIGQTNYAATKGGVITMTKTWSKELARRGVRANCVAPGFIRTPMTDELPEKVIANMENMTPLRRMGEAEDVANAVIFLASQDSSFITGQTIQVTGGLVL